MKVSSLQKLPEAFKNLDLCLTHAVYLEAISEYFKKGGKSRGSFLVLDTDGQKPCEKLGDEWRFGLNEEESFVEKKILEVRMDENGELSKDWVDIRPIPREESWFENIWKDFLADNFFET
jgi:hypothetical protein